MTGAVALAFADQPGERLRALYASDPAKYKRLFGGVVRTFGDGGGDASGDGASGDEAVGDLARKLTVALAALGALHLALCGTHAYGARCAVKVASLYEVVKRCSTNRDELLVDANRKRATVDTNRERAAERSRTEIAKPLTQTERARACKMEIRSRTYRSKKGPMCRCADDA